MTHEHHHCDGHEHHHDDCSCHDNAEQQLPSPYTQALGKYNLHIHTEDAQAIASRLIADRKAHYDTQESRALLLKSLDLTSLRVTDSQESVLRFIETINHTYGLNSALPHPAAVCLYPQFARIASESLEIDDMAVACVAGGFPSAQTFSEIKVAEVSLAVHDGATEIDTVLNVGAFLSEDYETVCDEIGEIKEACGDDIPLKVILETGTLDSAQNIKKAAILAMYSGADFIKTSTGKISPAATPWAAWVMCTAICEYYAATGTRIGFKAAGGIRTISDALDYLTIAAETLGREWIAAGLFRIGATSLEQELLKALV